MNNQVNLVPPEKTEMIKPDVDAEAKAKSDAAEAKAKSEAIQKNAAKKLVLKPGQKLVKAKVNMHLASGKYLEMGKEIVLDKIDMDSVADVHSEENIKKLWA